MMRLAVCALALVALLAPKEAPAQGYPVRPVTLVVPLAPGGSTDVIGRIVAEGMGGPLGQSIVVENVSGAGGSIGVTRVARAAPDGYTFLIGQWGTNVASGAIYNLTFDLLKDLEPIGLIATQPFLVVSRKTLPAGNLTELIAWLKTNPDKATMGHAGIGSPSHVGGIFLQNAVGFKWAMVSYRSAGQTMQDLLTGNIDVALDTPATSRPHLEAGSIKAYAVTSRARIAALPELPTVNEAGVPGYFFSFWHALWAPKGTPREALTKLNDSLVATLAAPATRNKLIGLSQEIFPREQQTPTALAAFQKSEIETWWPVIKAAGIKPQ